MNAAPVESVGRKMPEVRGTDAKKAAICICTRQRPVMLLRCLNSLAAQKIPEDVAPVLIVVDNDPASTARRVVDSVSLGFPIRYKCEPEAGIARARNTAVCLAQHEDADWIAFIDDDEVADPNWLEALVAPEYRDVPILMGWQIVQLPEDRPFWALDHQNEHPAEGQSLKVAFTHNVRMSIDVPNSGLRFNEHLSFGGGEDAEYFSAAHNRGFAIKQTARAITYETLHSERLTFRGQIYRAYWVASAKFRKDFAQHGRTQTIMKRGHTIPLNIVAGIVLLIASPMAIAFGFARFKRMALDGGGKIARGVGRMVAVFGHIPQPYSAVDGH
jgi:succinoglycan biosynthesis protein ExoM